MRTWEPMTTAEAVRLVKAVATEWMAQSIAEMPVVKAVDLSGFSGMLWRAERWLGGAPGSYTGAP